MTLFERYFPQRKGGAPKRTSRAAPQRHITRAGNGKRARLVVGSDTKKPG